MRRLSPLCLVALAFALAGCGNKGPLVMPTKTPAAAATTPAPAASTPAPATSAPTPQP